MVRWEVHRNSLLQPVLVFKEWAPCVRAKPKAKRNPVLKLCLSAGTWTSACSSAPGLAVAFSCLNRSEMFGQLPKRLNMFERWPCHIGWLPRSSSVSDMDPCILYFPLKPSKGYRTHMDGRRLALQCLEVQVPADGFATSLHH